MPPIRSDTQIICKIAQYSAPLLCPRCLADRIPNRLFSSYWNNRSKKKKTETCPVNFSHLPSDQYGNRCGYYFAMHEPKRSFLSRLFRRGSKKTVPLPTNYCPQTAVKHCPKEQVYWFGFERDEIDELCSGTSKPPLQSCRKQQRLLTEACGCLPPAQICDPTRFHYPGLCIIRENYSTQPLVYRRCEPKPRQAPKPSMPPAVGCLKMACSFNRWIPVTEESPKTAAALLQATADPYDEFNYAQRQEQSKQSAQIILRDYCAGNA